MAFLTIVFSPEAKSYSPLLLLCESLKCWRMWYKLYLYTCLEKKLEMNNFFNLGLEWLIKIKSKNWSKPVFNGQSKPFKMFIKCWIVLLFSPPYHIPFLFTFSCTSAFLPFFWLHLNLLKNTRVLLWSKAAFVQFQSFINGICSPLSDHLVSPRSFSSQVLCGMEASVSSQSSTGT